MKKRRTTKYFENLQDIRHGFVFTPAYSFGVQNEETREGLLFDTAYKGNVSIQDKRQDSLNISPLPINEIFPLDDFYLWGAGEALQENLLVTANFEFTALPVEERRLWSCWLIIGGILCVPERLDDAISLVQSWRFHNA